MNELAIFEKLPFKSLSSEIEPYRRRVLLFDPAEVYSNIETSPFTKHQKGLTMATTFPEKKDGLCDCGCGKLIAGRRRRWASDECQQFAYFVYLVITGDWFAIHKLLEDYYGERRCRICKMLNETNFDKDPTGDSTVKIGYIISVKEGGGGCWLNNYQFICNDCRHEKEEERKALKQLPRNGLG